MRHSIILPSLLLLAHNVRAGCFFSDRTMDKNVEYQPCSEDPSNPLSTICCATNRKDGADICAPNGLCQVGTKKGSPPAQPAWTKPSCTNQDWSEDGCLHVCGTDKYPFLTPCNRAAGNSSQRWCCGMTQDCCSDDGGADIQFLPITFDPRNFTAASPSSSAVSSSKPTSPPTKTPSPSADAPASSSQSRSFTSSPATSPTSTPLSTGAQAGSATASTPTPPPSTPLSTGAKAGIAIGVIAAALALLALGILWGRRRSTKPPSHPFSPAVDADAAPLEKYAHWDHELGAAASREGSVGGMPPVTPWGHGKGGEVEVMVYEMPVCEVRGELDGSGVGVLGGEKVVYV